MTEAAANLKLYIFKENLRKHCCIKKIEQQTWNSKIKRDGIPINYLTMYVHRL